mgnify:CR=1 FL=1
MATAALRTLVRMALAQGGPGVFHDRGRGSLLPCVTQSAEDRLRRAQLRAPRARPDNPIPKMPILFNKFNNALNCHQGTVRGVEDPGDEFRLRVRARDRHGPAGAERKRGRGALLRVRLLQPATTSPRATCRVAQQPVDDRQDLRRLRAARALPRHRGPGGDPEQPQDRGHASTAKCASRRTRATWCSTAPQIISYTSKLMTLQPGDIIYTGTPEGVISGYPKEKQVWLKPGDKLRRRSETWGRCAFRSPDQKSSPSRCIASITGAAGAEFVIAGRRCHHFRLCRSYSHDMMIVDSQMHA